MDASMQENSSEKSIFPEESDFNGQEEQAVTGLKSQDAAPKQKHIWRYTY